MAVASITADARAAVRQAKLDDNQSVLLKVAKVEPGMQAEAVRQIAAEREGPAFGNIQHPAGSGNSEMKGMSEYWRLRAAEDRARTDALLLARDFRAFKKAWKNARPGFRDKVREFVAAEKS